MFFYAIESLNLNIICVYFCQNMVLSNWYILYNILCNYADKINEFTHRSLYTSAKNVSRCIWKYEYIYILIIMNNQYFVFIDHCVISLFPS